VSWGEIVPWRAALVGAVGIGVFLGSGAYGVGASSYCFGSAAGGGGRLRCVFCHRHAFWLMGFVLSVLLSDVS